MAQENDVSGREAAGARESAATERARRRAIEGDYAPSASDIGQAVAAALERARQSPAAPQRNLPPFVRASVRCGYETTRRVAADGSAQMVTSPAEVRFKANETKAGVATSVPHGRPVHLTREAFLRYESDGKVIIAQ